jgi:hypothetical protein
LSAFGLNNESKSIEEVKPFAFGLNNESKPIEEFKPFAFGVNNESKPINPKLDIEQYYALMLGNGILVKAESDTLAQWKAAMKSLD